MKHSPSIAIIAKALSLAQGEIKDIAKSATAAKGTRNAYDYATLPDILKEIRRVFSKNDISFTQNATHTGGEIYEYQTKFSGKKKAKVGGDVLVTGLLMHESGEWIEYESSYPSLITFNMNEIQAVGASVAYARKYQIIAVAGIAGEEDTDANTPSVDKQPEKTDKPKKDNWYAAYIKKMEEVKKALGDKDYHDNLLEYGYKHSNEVKVKDVAMKIYKSMNAIVKLRASTKKTKKSENA